MQPQEPGRLPPTAVWTWAESLPDLAADVVTDADLTQPYLHVPVEVLPSRLAPLRSRVLDWTYAVGLLEHERQDIVMATDEALSNAMEHAFPDGMGKLTLFAARDRLARAVHVVVSDNGTWAAPLSPSAGRGMGLAMMDRLADVFDLHHDERGTTVVLRWSRRANA
ncbi:ATP-binding protein [Kibdelosporangium aridum]|uniref:Anti-sigma regulatory factor (Ser/Thr protein kinase) n=1 Tax=Kibdelosporangium aridum TaxID=2030 RepID=A0A1W2FSR8_KIBAR|nr:ATP-binding protein [Kibdelosporangium aridum]SMD24971.1 Anti-sigma regulatory factor (Ser/Thr protein kinase) [Kibdelosporangium aridum]